MPGIPLTRADKLLDVPRLVIWRDTVESWGMTPTLLFIDEATPLSGRHCQCVSVVSSSSGVSVNGQTLPH